MKELTDSFPVLAEQGSFDEPWQKKALK